MNINEFQFNIAKSIAEKQFLSSGIRPSMSDIMRVVRHIVGDIGNGEPTVRIKHLRRGKIDLKTFNDFWASAGFDLTVLRQALIEEAGNLAKMSLLREMDADRLDAEIADLEAQYQELLGNPKGESVSIGFSDTDDLNLENSTCLYDPCAGEILLRPSSGHQKLSLKHLESVSNYLVTLIDVPASQVIRNSVVRGCEFKHCISSNERIWMQEIAISNWNKPIRIRLELNVASSGTEHVSQVSLVPHVSGQADIRVYTASDGRNFSALDVAQSTTGRKLNFIGYNGKISKIRIEFLLSDPTEIKNGISYYRVGLENLEIYRASYMIEGEATTGVKEVGEIGVISMDSSEILRPGTSIDYFLRLSNNSRVTDWFQIEPKSRDERRSSFEFTVRDSMKFSGNLILDGGEATKVAYRNGLSFYSIGQVDSSHDINLATAKVYRGRNAWQMESLKERRQGSANNIFVNFRFQSNDGSQPLYIYKTEEAEIASGILVGTTQVGEPILRVRHPIDYNPASNQLIPTDFEVRDILASDSDNMDQYHPTYSVTYVRKDSQGAPITREQGTIKKPSETIQEQVAGSLTTEGSSLGFYLDPAVQTDLLNLPSSYPYPIFITGTARTIDGVEEEISGFVQITGPQTIIENQLAKTVLAVDTQRGYGLSLSGFNSIELQEWSIGIHDLTKFVDKIEGRNIYFKSGVEFNSDDRISVRYRARFNRNLRIVPGTMMVTNAPGGTSYTEGTDYYIDPEFGKIAAPITGKIMTGNLSSCYCTFNWEEQFAETFRISANFFADSGAGSEFIVSRFGGRISTTEVNSDADYDTNDIEPDPTRGEFVSISSSGQSFNLIRGTSITLGSGWHQIVIQAANLKRLRDFMTAVDENGVFIFAVNSHFGEQIASLEPLTYVSPEVLYESAMLGKTTKFTIGTSSQVVVPFNPDSNCLVDNEIYKIYKGELTDVDLSSGSVTRPGEVPSVTEQFKIEYSYLPMTEGYDQEPSHPPEYYLDNGVAPILPGSMIYDRIEVKAKLKREIGGRSEISPSVKSITLRITR